MTIWPTYVKLIQSPALHMIVAGVVITLLIFSSSGVLAPHSQSFSPHIQCIPDRRVVLEYVIAHSAIAMSLWIMAGFMFYVHYERMQIKQALNHQWVIWAFASAIALDGFTHAASVLTMFVPYYYLEGALSGLTAAVSVLTALAAPYLVMDWLHSLESSESSESRDAKDASNTR